MDLKLLIDYKREKNLYKKLYMWLTLVRNVVKYESYGMFQIESLIEDIYFIYKKIIKTLPNTFTLKTVSRLAILDMFYTLLIRDLKQIVILLKNKDLIELYRRFKVLQYEVLKDYYKLKKDYKKYFWLIMYKYFSLYGTSYKYLTISVIVVTVIFWLLFLLSDVFLGTHVWDGSNLLYYFYISMSTLSNLWVDTSLANTWWLIILFTVEQVVWLLIFWIFVYTLSTDI